MEVDEIDGHSVQYTLKCLICCQLALLQTSAQLDRTERGNNNIFDKQQWNNQHKSPHKQAYLKDARRETAGIFI